MSGVISAGSIPAAEAGAEILRAGGNAVDAAVAACFAVCAGEPTLTSLAGGGMMLIRDGESGDVRILDFFGNAPSLRQSEVDELDFYNIDLNYGPTTQRFYVGAGAAGVPGSIPGLCTAAEKFGSMSLADITAPACALLRHGAVLGPRQADLADFLKPILINKPASREVFAPQGRFIRAGDLFTLPELADTIENLGSGPWRDAYRERVESAFLAQCGPNQGGLLQQADFDAYEVIEREPLTMNGPHGAISTVPAPAAGGPMISLMRRLVEHDVSAGFDRVRVLCAAMATADEVRVADKLEEANASLAYALDRYRGRLLGDLEAPSAPGGPACTTHISVVDSQGNAVGVTLSHGESNAQLIEGTGILMNNFLGEDDLLPKGLGTATPGRRLATMMSPSMVSLNDGRIHVLGTGGSNRIRTAILQVIGRLLDDGYLPQDAVDAPRIHYEAGVLNAEFFGDVSEPLLKELAGDRLVQFDAPHLFFGGVQLASKLNDGTLCGGGDPRRGGHVIIV